jgi:3-oxoacyl-[acyl-carrier protein] reductase
MSKKLEGKIALITGGSRGIGAAIAKRLAADGAKVAITYTKGADAASAVVKAIERAGGKAIAIQADAADADAGKAAVERTVATFGRLDVLVNNAGTAIPKPFVESTLEEMDRVLDINVRGVFVATQAALKHMTEGGRIIMIGSAVGERAVAPGLVPYAATKGAVKMFTQALSREVGSRGITVNNIQPGPIDTELIPLREIGQYRRRPPPRSTAMGMLRRSPQWQRFSRVRNPPTSRERILPSMAE